MSARPTVLFVADAVTLAHVARPFALAQRLDPQKYAVVLACDGRYGELLRGARFPVVALASLDSARFLRAVAQGRPVYDAGTLESYVAADLALFELVRPSVVIGDHRLSLSISARVAKIPYLNIINAYWSPYAADRDLFVPELAATRWLGVGVVEAIFRRVWPLASAWHASPLNKVCHAHGLPSLGTDWLRAYTDGDHTLYADASELVPTRGLPATHSYLGPVPWSPEVPLPDWWDSLPGDRPVVYATMGSSGDPAVLELILAALADLPITVIVTTVARPLKKPPPGNARLTAYAPGATLAARADVMVCNGGSLTAYQSLLAGKPVIGIASHMDQQLSMACVERAGVGRRLRSDQLQAAALRTAVVDALADAAQRRRCAALSHVLRQYDPAARLTGVLGSLL